MHGRGSATAVVLCLLLAGCSDSDATPTPTVLAPTGPSPMEPYIALFDPVREQSRSEQERQREEFIAACMAEQGFSYVPFVTSDLGLQGQELDDLFAAMGTREFAETYGYGQALDVFGTQAVWDALAADPNLEITAAMSAAELNAYRVALSGTGDAFAEDADGVTTYDWTKAGCEGAAQHEVGGDEPLVDTEHEDIFAEYYDTFALAMRDPRVTAAKRAWSDCMADAGYPGLTSGPPQGGLDLVNQWRREARAEVFAAAGRDPFTDTEDAVMTRQIEQAWAALLEDEIALAVADYDCAEASGHEAASAAALWDVEQAFLDTYKAELDAWLASTQADGE